MNSAIIGSLALVGTYLIMRNDVDAIASLYAQPDWSIPEVSSRLEVTIAVLQRLPSDWLGWYDAEALARPVLTKAATSSVCYYAGDLIAQITAGRTLESVDLGRSTRSAAAGFIGHGPVAHYWLQFVDSALSFDGAWVRRTSGRSSIDRAARFFPLLLPHPPPSPPLGLPRFAVCPVLQHPSLVCAVGVRAKDSARPGPNVHRVQHHIHRPHWCLRSTAARESVDRRARDLVAGHAGIDQILAHRALAHVLAAHPARAQAALDRLDGDSLDLDTCASECT